MTKRKTRETWEKFLHKNPSASVDFFDFGENSEISKLYGMISSGGSLFSEKKMIVISGLFNQNEETQKKVLKLIEHVAGKKNISIVISEGIIKQKKGKLFQFLSINSKNIEHKKFDAREIVYWIGSEVGRRGKNKIAINISAQNRLAQISKNNLWKINSEIDKLVAYKMTDFGGNTTITLEDVNLLCQGEIESKIFDLVDTLGARNKSRAVEILKKIIIQGENEFYIFSMFLYQLRNLAVVAAFRDKFGPNPQLISQQTGMHPFVAKKTLDQSRNFSKKQIKRLYGLAARLDLEVKTGARERMEDALVYFIAIS